jgi:hypothetical protein
MGQDDALMHVPIEVEASSTSDAMIKGLVNGCKIVGEKMLSDGLEVHHIVAVIVGQRGDGAPRGTAVLGVPEPNERKVEAMESTLVDGMMSLARTLAGVGITSKFKISSTDPEYQEFLDHMYGTMPSPQTLQ